ncbi:MAG: hypothetical protein LBG72_03105, partial [Spirochaetaceae bacterium]|nr:hypothetical protein [Spirochaetaceae bacterium]
DTLGGNKIGYVVLTPRGAKPPFRADPVEAFKAELDGGGEYQQVGTWTETRDWDKGVAFARFAIRPNGELHLDLCKADNSVLGYRYKKK